MKRAYKCKADLPDHRDYRFTVSVPRDLPKKVDLRKFCPQVYDQGALGSCTAQAVSGSCEFEMVQNKRPIIAPSRLFVYYNTRSIEGSLAYDAGATIRNAIKSVAKWGFCDEKIWPYVIKKFAAKPLEKCYKSALPNKLTTTKYMRIWQSPNDIKTCLAAGNTIVCGIAVYESFDSLQVKKTGKVPMPLHSESHLGGHAIVLVGYDEAKQVFIARNSWGTGWGMKGYFTIPFAYILNRDLAFDFWTIRFEEPLARDATDEEFERAHARVRANPNAMATRRYLKDK